MQLSLTTGLTTHAECKRFSVDKQRRERKEEKQGREGRLETSEEETARIAPDRRRVAG